MSPRARLTQERSRKRRDSLLDAAIALFAEGGEPAISHRAVARRAGVSPATTSYYFGSIEALVDEALARHMETWTRDLRQLAERPTLPGLTQTEAVDAIEAMFAERTPEMSGLRLSVYLAATRSETLRPRAAAALAEVEALVKQLLDQAGIEDAERLARACVAIIGGTAMARLSRRHSNRDQAEQLFWSLRGIFLSALMDEDEKDRRIREFRDSRRT